MKLKLSKKECELLHASLRSAFKYAYLRAICDYAPKVDLLDAADISVEAGNIFDKEAKDLYWYPNIQEIEND